MRFSVSTLLLVLWSLLALGCKKESLDDPKKGIVVGSFTLTEQDLDTWIGRSRDLQRITEEEREEEQKRLIDEVRLAQYAIDSKLDQNSEHYLNSILALSALSKRAEILKPEEVLSPSEEELRAYARSLGQYQNIPEKRRVAALWIPAKETRSLNYALDFIKEHCPSEKRIKEGFGAVAIDYTYSQPHRYKGGMLGAVSLQDVSLSALPWMKEAIKRGFQLTEEGEVSPVITLENGDQMLVILQTIIPLRELPYSEIKKRVEVQWKNDQILQRKKLLHKTLQEKYPRK